MVKLELNPSRATLRSFGFIALFGFGLLAAGAWRRWALFAGLGEAGEPAALALGAVGVSSALLSLTAPQANRPLYVALSLASYPIGVLTSHLVMAALYFGLFAPIGMVFRALGRDPLARHRDPSATSYWTPSRKARSTEDYFRQY